MRRRGCSGRWHKAGCLFKAAGRIDASFEVPPGLVHTWQQQVPAYIQVCLQQGWGVGGAYPDTWNPFPPLSLSCWGLHLEIGAGWWVPSAWKAIQA
jgi:hypothetical protein